MALSYKTPGIYVEETPSGPRPIEALGTSTVGFIGTAPNANAHVNELVPVTNWLQFVKKFVSDGDQSTELSHAVFGFFQNCSGLCYIVNVGKNGNLSGSGGAGREGLDLFEEIDEIAIVAAPGCTDPASYDAVLTHCEKMKDRVAVLDGPKEVALFNNLTKVAAPKPTTGSGDDSDVGTGTSATKEQGLRARTSDSGFGAFYFPWLVVKDPLSPKKMATVPPSGHIAGIYARVDSTRGVHKAPANEPIRGALDLAYRVTREEQGELNINGVNCIRFFPGQGIRVWGARTLAESSSEWKYINVRRLFNMIEESIARSTQWVVFEPNDETLWNSIKRDVSAFLTMLWRQGALKGTTPEEAFFVKCDEEINPSDVINAGIVVTVIGVAPVKPAEFVVFKIGQSEGGIETSEEE